MLLGAAGILVVLAVLAVVPAFAARARLETARQELEHAQQLLLEGNIQDGSAAFARAQSEFDEARALARSPALRALGWVPLAGRSVDAVVVLADAGGRIASAGVEVTEAIEGLDGGIAALAPRDGRIQVDAIGELGPAAAAARSELEAALESVGSLPTSWLVAPVADARDEAMRELGDAVNTARAAEAVTTALPGLVGADGEQRYFVAAQTPAELRGTGGFMGAYSILKASDGKLVLQPMRSITALPDASPERAPTPPEGFGAPFDRFGGPGFWRNLNMTPHAPTSARLIESLYEQVTGERLDGVIFVDPQALADMLEATGPVTPESLDRTLEAETVVDYLAHDAYLEFGSAAQRKKVLGAAVESVLERFLGGTEPVAATQAMAEAAGGGHLVFHSTDPGVQAALESAGIAGAVEASAGDYFAFFASNADGTKVDYFIKRHVDYDVALDPDGRSFATATVESRNRAPEDAEPSYVLGPYPGTGLGPGESRSFVAAYCGPGCRLEGASLDGEPVGLETHEERGLPIFSTFVQTAPQTTSSLALELGREESWVGDELGGTYRVTIRSQPTVRPTTGTVSIEVPDGMDVVQTNVPMEIADGVATWNGNLGYEEEFVIRFQRPFPDRAWTQLLDFLSSPIFGD